MFEITWFSYSIKDVATHIGCSSIIDVKKFIKGKFQIKEAIWLKILEILEAIY